MAESSLLQGVAEVAAVGLQWVGEPERQPRSASWLANHMYPMSGVVRGLSVGVVGCGRRVSGRRSSTLASRQYRSGGCSPVYHPIRHRE